MGQQSVAFTMDQYAARMAGTDCECETRREAVAARWQQNRRLRWRISMSARARDGVHVRGDSEPQAQPGPISENFNCSSSAVRSHSQRSL
jgi:hypothetical protein